MGFDYPLHSHAVLGDLATAAEPVLFLKLPDSVCGPYDPLVKPPETAALDYGIELAVVIGRAGRRIAPGDASGHIVGYISPTMSPRATWSLAPDCRLPSRCRCSGGRASGCDRGPRTCRRPPSIGTFA
ncbi:fumarylacetoacetate hydrolase family protein [Streptomyces sp. NPDC059802]|uniref:fumarylacetoacetate hydrolase family protein n=1 Tax=Streptomyces sp. NPDC059802 TaxID=3346952 RepID=UPI003650DD67